MVKDEAYITRTMYFTYFHKYCYAQVEKASTPPSLTRLKSGKWMFVTAPKLGEGENAEREKFGLYFVLHSNLCSIHS